jgi:hypothetical protein
MKKKTVKGANGYSVGNEIPLGKSIDQGGEWWVSKICHRSKRFGKLLGPTLG